jgi:hypothetical protein
MHMSSHAKSQAVTRNISEDEIDSAIKYGSRWHCDRDPNIHYARLNGVLVVMHGRSSFVLTAYAPEH